MTATAVPIDTTSRHFADQARIKGIGAVQTTKNVAHDVKENIALAATWVVTTLSRAARRVWNNPFVRFVASFAAYFMAFMACWVAFIVLLDYSIIAAFAALIVGYASVLYVGFGGV